MRLINTHTLRLESFRDSNAPPYAILSHRWQEEEVSFQNIGSSHAESRKGYAKLAGFCRIAASEGYQYAWMDTCCIDKRWSSEESEAINSMYRWYSQAGCCYTYLCDVRDGGKRFEHSIWFTRGWTLQELIAPRRVQFYNADWRYLGCKTSLLEPLVRATGVDVRVLQGAHPNICSIAQRLSWAADRTTERVEDRAYSLVGLFNISLTANYGEREESFVRLQKEIMKESDDQSIFAWEYNQSSHCQTGQLHGLLAHSPSAFRGCQGVLRSSSSGLNLDGFSLGQLGLTITLWTRPWAMNQYLAVLDCEDGSVPSRRYGIVLEKLSTPQQYARVCQQGCGRYLVTDLRRQLEQKRFTHRRVSVRQNIVDLPLSAQVYGFKIGTLDLPGYRDSQTQRFRICSRSPWLPAGGDPNLVVLPTGDFGTAGVLYSTNYRHKWYSIRHIRLAFDTEFNPIVMLSADGSGKSKSAISPRADPMVHSLIPSGTYQGRNFDWWHEPAFSNAWIETRPKQWTGIPTRDDILNWPGVCILRGSADGIAVTIPVLNICVRLEKQDHSPCYNSPQQQSTTSTDNIALIWTLSIVRTKDYDHPDSILNQINRKKRTRSDLDLALMAGMLTGLA